LYYNFGYFGLIGSTLIGFFVTKVSQRINRFKENGDYLGILFMLPIIMSSFWWVRDSFLSLTRTVVWSFLLIQILIVFYRSVRITAK